MAYIPRDVEWYIAELVEEITVEGSDHNVVHQNLVLVNANSPEEAYSKAMSFGAEAEISYKNPEGKVVKTRFCGLGDLVVIYDPLEDGSELMYTERVGVPVSDLARLTRPKERLTAFMDKARETARPDYRSGDIVKEVEG